jgi:hypothetical protein
MSKPQKEKTIQPWDRRPWPNRGDPDRETIYLQVGQFISLWERLEAALAFLFANFSAPYPQSEPARRAFFAVRTFEGRSDMLKAASEAYFGANYSSELQTEMKDILSLSKCYSQRRNEIAHGLVDQFQAKDDFERYGWLEDALGYALYPSIASFKERDLRGVPTYCMAASDTEYFYNRILEIQPRAIKLGDAIRKRLPPSLGKPRPPTPA